MAPRKKPDATDTEPPEEARPDTTATPLLVEDGKLLPQGRKKNSFDGASEVRSRVRRGVLSLRVVLQMWT